MQVIVVFLVFTYFLSTDALPSNGKRITFSTATSIDYEKIQFNENILTPDTPEYYKSLRWVAVNREGMQYKGTLDEVMQRIKSPRKNPTEDRYSYSEQQPSTGNPSGGFEDNSFKAAAAANYGSETEPHFELEDLFDIKSRKGSAEKRSVIGADERFLISNPNDRYPHTAMGRVEIGCSGAFIAPRTILTAGHCVHGGRGRQWYDRLDFKRAKQCDPLQGVQWHYWNWAVTLDGWIDNSLVTHDIAVITVFESVAVNNIMHYEYVPSLSTTTTIEINGYPGDKRGKCMYGSRCTLATFDDKRLYYQCDTAGGMSGSPVYVYSSSSRRYTIWGVHAYGLGRGVNNKATRITQEYENTLKEWINDYEGN